MLAYEGCSSIADSAGNLLFYTEGKTVWNRFHQVMSNGTGLLGDSASTQSGLIVKQPGNRNIYFVFSLDYLGHANGLHYSTVDMDQANGLGAVTIKNTLIVTPSSEKLAAVRHCNGEDIWVVSHDYPGNTFRANLVTASGVSSEAVLSSTGIYYMDVVFTQGSMKFSPDGKRLGACAFYFNIPGAEYGGFEIFDFDNATGVVSNAFTLKTSGLAYGCEFSPDGSKFYGVAMAGDTRLSQWDLNAGSGPAIAASEYGFPVSRATSLQLAVNGKIYISKNGQGSMDVIDNPNAGGANCNYVANAQPVSPNLCKHGLPNFVTGSKVKNCKVPPCDASMNYSIPNAFSPNGDGKNDEFCLQGWSACPSVFSVMIFDRWGERVFESADPDFCWDGVYKGQKLNADVFVYVIRSETEKKVVNKKGNIALIR